jgi:alpha-L-rhamnosidase
VERGKVEIKPQPHPLLGRAEARYRSPLGEIVSGWRYDSDEMVRYHIAVPANVTAEVTLPDGRTCTLGPGEHDL